MEVSIVSRIALFIVIVGFGLHRVYYHKRNSKSKNDIIKEPQKGASTKIVELFGTLGLALSVVYLLSPNLISFANAVFPNWLRWLGLATSLTGFALLHWAQRTLGASWSGEPRMLKGQTLITNGPYQFIRHPIYSAFILILGSTLFITSNWLVGLCWLVMTTWEVASRIEVEESLMIEYFGDQYLEYMKQTGRLLPRITN